MSDGHGVFGEAAELPKPQYNIYCPLMDCGDFKRSWKLNYFKKSCAGRLSRHACNSKVECHAKPATPLKLQPKYNFMGMGYLFQGSRWIVVDFDMNVVVKGLPNIARCKTVIRTIREAQGGYETLEK